MTYAKRSREVKWEDYDGRRFYVWYKRGEGPGGGGGGGHSPWFWVPTAKQTPGALTVGQKKGGCHGPKTSHKRGCQRGISSWGCTS